MCEIFIKPWKIMNNRPTGWKVDVLAYDALQVLRMCLKC